MTHLHPALQRLLGLDAGQPAVETLSVKAARARMLQRAASLPRAPVGSVVDRVFEHRGRRVGLRIYRPEFDGIRPALVYFHGGGFVLGSNETHDALCRRFCADAEMVVVSVDYALAPENRFPAGLEDCFEALLWTRAWIADHGGDPRRIFLGGDSAGANLALATVLAVAAEGGEIPAGLLLAYPVADDPDRGRPSYATYGSGFGLTAAAMRWYCDLYLDRPERRRDPSFAILQRDDFGTLPPTFLITAEFDPLRDEGIELAKRLKEAGVALQHMHKADANHGFLSGAGITPPSEDAIASACGWLRAELRQPVG